MHTLGDKCLLFVTKSETWETARSNCQRWGNGVSGNLVTISDKATMRAITGVLNTDFQWTNFVWIGLKSRHGRWEWAAGNYCYKKLYIVYALGFFYPWYTT